MTTILRGLLAFLILPIVSSLAQHAHPAESPGSSPSSPHHDAVDERGDQGMGFSHKMTGHHFHILADGGAIEVEANDPADQASQKAIRDHLAAIAGMFSKGDFSVPMFIHATNPPGMETMQRLKNEISYSAENTRRGAQVKIHTTNPDAIKAIHAFLRFQIEEHRTGDPTTVQPSAAAK
jgi:TusA-related sulfurtransferase